MVLFTRVWETASQLRSPVLFNSSILPLISSSSSLLIRVFGACFKGSNNSWYHCRFHVPQLLELSGKVIVFVLLLASFSLHSVVRCHRKIHNLTSFFFFAQSAGAVEYTDCFYAEELHPLNECPVWHKTIRWWGSSDAGALGNVEYLFIATASRSTLGRSDSTW